MKTSSFVAICFALAAILFGNTIARADQKAIQDAKKAVAEAQAAVTKAQGDLDKAKSVVKAELAKDPEYAATTKDLAKAKHDLEAATKPVLDKVHASPEYLAAKKSFEDNDAKVKDIQVRLRSGGAGDAALAQEMAAANTARGKAKTQLEQLDNDALASDPTIAAAKQKIADSQKKIDEIEAAKLPDMVGKDQPCKDAQTKLEEAQKQLADAKATLDQAIKDNKSGMGGGHKGGAGRRGG